MRRNHSTAKASPLQPRLVPHPWLRRILRFRHGSTGGASVAVALCSTLAIADPSPSLDLRFFQPPTDPTGALYLESSNTQGAGNWTGTAWLSWAARPVVLRTADHVTSKLVAHQTSLDVTSSVGIGSSGSIGLALPVVVYQTGDPPPAQQEMPSNTDLPRQALGDLQLTAKANLLPVDQMGGFGFAGLARVGFPTGDRIAYVGEGAVWSEVRALAELRLIAASLQATAGFRLRTEERRFFDRTWGNEVPWGVALSVNPRTLGLDDSGRWIWTIESRGALPAGPASPFSDSALAPASIAGSATYTIDDWSLRAGVEAPLNSAVGLPLFRTVTALQWVSRTRDLDEDGVEDSVDECPELAEDRDGIEDEDGCPESDPDGDNDGIPDNIDRCPNDSEDWDDFEDEDGCSDPDNDKDGVPDAADLCPLIAGPKAGKRPGCQPLDTDNDGVKDDVDKCPNDPEDRDGFQDTDGCPDRDNDNDGVPDNVDRCPIVAGPPSSIANRNGCPIPDADGDTIEDSVDMCPEQRESWNAVKDDDGCPDAGRALVRVVTTASGPTLQPRAAISFDGSDDAPEVAASSLPVIRALATEINQHPNWIVAVGARPKRADRDTASSRAMARSFAVVLALGRYTLRDGSAETVGWRAVQDQPTANAIGVGFLLLGHQEKPPSNSETP